MASEQQQIDNSAVVAVLDRVFSKSGESAALLKIMQAVPLAKASLSTKECGKEMKKNERSSRVQSSLPAITDEFHGNVKTIYATSGHLTFPSWITSSRLQLTTLGKDGKEAASCSLHGAKPLMPSALRACVYCFGRQAWQEVHWRCSVD
jgi:hypothetical protein